MSSLFPNRPFFVGAIFQAKHLQWSMVDCVSKSGFLDVSSSSNVTFFIWFYLCKCFGQYCFLVFVQIFYGLFQKCPRKIRSLALAFLVRKVPVQKMMSLLAPRSKVFLSCWHLYVLCIFFMVKQIPLSFCFEFFSFGYICYLQLNAIALWFLWGFL